MASLIAKTIYAQQAVREYMGQPRLKVSRSVRMKIDRLLGQINDSHAVLIDGLYHPDPSFTAIQGEEMTIRIGGRAVDVNPFTCDAVDVFLLLKARDADQAKRQNGQGFNKPDSVIASRLLDRIDVQGFTRQRTGDVRDHSSVPGTGCGRDQQVHGNQGGRGRRHSQSALQDGAITKSLWMIGLTDPTLDDNSMVGAQGGYQPRKRPPRIVTPQT